MTILLYGQKELPDILGNSPYAFSGLLRLLQQNSRHCHMVYQADHTETSTSHGCSQLGPIGNLRLQCLISSDSNPLLSKYQNRCTAYLNKAMVEDSIMHRIASQNRHTLQMSLGLQVVLRPSSKLKILYLVTWTSDALTYSCIALV